MQKLIKLSLIIIAASLAGCDQIQTIIYSASTTIQPAEFELRDFSVSKKDGSEYGTTFVGRGSLVSTSPSLKGKKIAVMLDFKVKNPQERSDNTERSISTIVTDGVGLIETSEYRSGKDPLIPNYGDWKITGYFILQPGTLIVK